MVMDYFSSKLATVSSKSCCLCNRFIHSHKQLKHSLEFPQKRSFCEKGSESELSTRTGKAKEGMLFPPLSGPHPPWVQWLWNRRVEYWAICLLTHSLIPLTHSLALHCSLRSPAPLRSLTPEHLGKRIMSMNWMRRFYTVSAHSAMDQNSQKGIDRSMIYRASKGQEMPLRSELKLFEDDTFNW